VVELPESADPELPRRRSRFEPGVPLQFPRVRFSPCSGSPAELPGARPRWRRRDIHATASVESPTKVPDHLAARVPCPSADLGERTYQRRSLDSASSSQASLLSQQTAAGGAPPRRAGRGRLQDVRCPSAYEKASACNRTAVLVYASAECSLHLDPTTSVWVAAAPWGNDLGSDSAALEH